MTNRSQAIVLFFRYLWSLLASILIVYVVSQNTRHPQVFTYQVDWARPLTANTTGWYPESRVSFQNNLLTIKAEPLYWQMYRPDDYKQLSVSGSVATSSEPIKLALRPKDGSWQWQDLNPPNFSVVYDLRNAQIKRNKLELILSVPSLQASSTVILANDWQFIFSR